jgi:hypothetical protein
MKVSRILAAMALAGLILAVAAVGRALPQTTLEEISGTITATRTITQNARLTGDVTCTMETGACITFGAPGITLNLNGFTLTGLADPSTGCQGVQSGGPGIQSLNQSDVTIQGPGLVQRFRASGIGVNNSSRVRIVDVTASTNCASGLLIVNTVDSHFEGNVAVRNGNVNAPCGGI